ncbi:MAG: hypothetical protein AB7G11_10420 [Phycisphaerales bacterium]
MCKPVCSRKLVLAASCGVVALAASSASATFSDPFLRVRVSSANGMGEFAVPLMDVTINPNGSAIWILPAPVNITDGPNTIATLTQITAFARPLSGSLPNLISIGFTFRAGAADTTFEIDSTLFGIAPIIDEGASCTAGATITDQNGNGATLTGANPSGQAFLSAYNGQGVAGTQFCSVIDNLATAPGGSANQNTTMPGGGLFTPIGDVQDMSTRWHFTLSGSDQVAGTSAFNIIPGPGALSILALGGLVASRRRR